MTPFLRHLRAVYSWCLPRILPSPTRSVSRVSGTTKSAWHALTLPSLHFPIASSSSLSQGKVVVTYGVEDKQSRALVMSTGFLDSQFDVTWCTS